MPNTKTPSGSHHHHHHTEQHFANPDTVKDIVLGMADGLTVPFALMAGLSGATFQSKVIIVAGLSEIAAGAISMGLGGYLAGKSAEELYQGERRREQHEVKEKPEVERAELFDIFKHYGVTHEESKTVVDALSRDHKIWVDFMMRFELNLEEPAVNRALKSAVAVGGAYCVGGLIPLSPYFIFSQNRQALLASSMVTLLALYIFGHVKATFTGARPVRSGLQTLFIGGLAAAAAYYLARLIS